MAREARRDERDKIHRAILIVIALGLALPATAFGAGPEGVLEGRAWEMVSPVEKNGGEVEAPGSVGSGALQAAAQGGAVAYASTASFAGGAGAAPSSQYLATRGGGGWTTTNVTPPQLAGTYGGGAYLLFSDDLSRGLMTSGWSCRDGVICAAENPPLAVGAPNGFRNLYLRESGAYRPLITTTNAPALSVDPEDFHLSLAGATPDLAHAAISTCAALTASAVEVPDGGGGCEASATNLYLWSGGTLQALNVLPGETQTTPGATLGAASGAISTDGARAYWKGADGNLYLGEEGEEAVQVDADAGGAGEFQAASTNGSLAYFTKAGHLYRYNAATDTATDLTPAGEVEGVLGSGPAGAQVYYLAATGLWLWREGPGPAGTTTKVANGADASNYPPATGTARVSDDGTRLAFVSSASLTGYPNGGKAEIYIYAAPTGPLRCVSCNPKGIAPKGPSTMPGAMVAGEGPAIYKPRSLSSDGRRVFFTSGDALVSADSDGRPDAYQWLAQGSGGCQQAAGCLGLLSGGRVGEAAFADASANGTDAYFLTSVSLLPGDSSAIDLYDTRVGGGFPEPEPEIECVGDACQGPPSAPDDPAPGTAIVSGPANPPIKFPAECKKKKRQGKGKKPAKCGGKKKSAKAKKRGGRR